MEAVVATDYRKISTSRTTIYLALVFVAVAGLAVFAAGRLSFTAYLGMLAGLVFIGLFVTDLRTFLLTYIVVRGLLEYFLVPTRVSLGGTSVQIIGALGALVLVGGFVHLVINRARIYEVQVVGPMLIFLVSTLPVSLLFSMDRIGGFKDWVGTASAFMLFLLIVTIFNTRKEIETLVKVLVFSAVPTLLIGFYQLIFGTGWVGAIGIHRVYATFAHPNAYALYLAMLLCLAIPLAIETRKRDLKIYYYLIVMAMTVSLIFTMTRAAWLVLILGLAIIAAVRYRRILLAMPVVLILVPLLIPSVMDRIAESMSFFEGTGSMFYRVEMWKYLMPRFFSSPVVGNGLGSFAVYVEEGLGRFNLPHNDYVRLLVDTGVIGLGAYIAMLYGLFRGAIKSYIHQTYALYRVISLALIAVIVVYVIGSLTENIFRAGTTQTYFWVLAGVVFASIRAFTVNNEHKQPEEQLAFEGLQP